MLLANKLQETDAVERKTANELLLINRLLTISKLEHGKLSIQKAEIDLEAMIEDVVVEVRYRTETRTDSEGNDYEVEVPYNYYICYVTLENKNYTIYTQNLRINCVIITQFILTNYSFFI